MPALKSPHLFESLLNKGDSLTLKPTANDRVSLRPPLRQRQYVVRRGFHDTPVLDLVLVAVVYIGDAALLVVLDPVHCVAAET